MKVAKDNQDESAFFMSNLEAVDREKNIFKWKCNMKVLKETFLQDLNESINGKFLKDTMIIGGTRSNYVNPNNLKQF